uniref:Uncharacterized protein n=1 Tax=Amphimedon queenslandica TaxID=400682 RepID=A0A1X7VJJ2_AMPQE
MPNKEERLYNHDYSNNPMLLYMTLLLCQLICNLVSLI